MLKADRRFWRDLPALIVYLSTALHKCVPSLIRGAAEAILSSGGTPHPWTQAADAHAFNRSRNEHVGGLVHSARRGVNRGIQRGTLVRKLSNSVPNVCLSVGSSYITTTT